MRSKPECLSPLLKECLEEKFLTSDLEFAFSNDLKHQKLLDIDREKVKRVINNALQNILTAVDPDANIQIHFSSSRRMVSCKELDSRLKNKEQNRKIFFHCCHMKWKKVPVTCT
ncbi:MAG: hypothetical protein AB8G05_09245 [Oligoflexales bacterium]